MCAVTWTFSRLGRVPVAEPGAAHPVDGRGMHGPDDAIVAMAPLDIAPKVLAHSIDTSPVHSIDGRGRKQAERAGRKAGGDVTKGKT